MSSLKESEKKTEGLKKFINNIEKEKPTNFLKLFFSYRNNRTGNYISFQPVISNDVQHEIFNAIVPYIKQQLSNNHPADYSPMGVLDGYFEIMDTQEVVGANKFFESVSRELLLRDLSEMKPEKIGFYCIEIKHNEKAAYIFRQFQKMKKLRNGFFCQLFDSQLRIVENILGFDQLSDIIIFENDLFLLNHIALERIFYYRDEIQKKADEAIREIKNKNIIVNVDSFSTDCLNDVRIMKRFTSLMTSGRLPLFFEHYSDVPGIVKQLDLDIQFDGENKLIYREKSQLFHIVNLLSDAYFESLLAKRTGIALVEGEIK